MEILIRATPDAVAKQAADIIAGYARSGSVLGLATGSTPIATYQELIRRHQREGLSFAGCKVFMLDEYLGLDPQHEQSYARTIRREFTEHIDINDADVFSPSGNSEDPLAAAAAYEQHITSEHVAIQLLGIGTNGHIGFNEPTSSLNSVTRMKTLHPQTIQDNARFFDDAEEVPTTCLPKVWPPSAAPGTCCWLLPVLARQPRLRQQWKDRCRRCARPPRCSYTRTRQC
ncbi:hypothetical protein N579_02775 [Corynebacterium pseudodiphtheriticum 090104]|nr:hypothetical protein N579_02775 [Corynebacterium pseudodiphtheriticum 090104]